MGISCLHKFLRKNCPEVYQEIHLSKYAFKKIAIDIAMQGVHGYHPEKSNYRINGIKDKTFSGYHILAYYYVSWALAIPEMLAEIKLPFDEEYKTAQQFFKSK